MLRFLRITRLAVIDSVEVEFDAGLNVLTGETGAGKSILVEAVGLLLGGRASGDLVRTGEEVAAIEAIFESGGEELLVRREITAQGRSRAFVNGALTTAGALKDLSARLIELHGQHEHQTLLDPSTHLSVVDAFGGLDAALSSTAATYETWRAVDDERARVVAASRDRDARLDLITFQLGELDKAAPKANEDEELAALRQVLASAERVERLCTESYASLYESDQAILAGLGQVWRRVAELAALDPQFQPYLEARDGIKGQLEDLALFLRRYADGIEASPARLQQVEERLALLERLKRKHGPALAEVIATREALRRELSDLTRGDERIQELERECRAAKAAYLSAAEALSRARRKIGVAFAKSLVGLLGELAMERTRFEVRFNDAPLAESAWTARGIDAAEFFLSPNPGEDLRVMEKIASGGEISRLMLALKTVVGQARLGRGGRESRRSRPTFVFDEIDSGIGGRVAESVGQRLKRLAQDAQVLCVTHLAQIACFADHHFYVEKSTRGGRTVTTVQPLEGERKRAEELARMLSGSQITDAVMKHATTMLRQAESESRSAEETPRDSARSG